jgi:hypothetical protein
LQSFFYALKRPQTPHNPRLTPYLNNYPQPKNKLIVGNFCVYTPKHLKINKLQKILAKKFVCEIGVSKDDV